MSRGIPLRRIVDLVREADENAELPFVSLENVEAGTGRLTATELPVRRGDRTTMATARTGDVLFGKLRPYLQKTHLIVNPVHIAAELLVLRCQPELEPRWLHYVVSSQPFIEWSVATSDGAKMPRTSWGALGEYRVATPTVAVQRAIADFLDTETTRIDALIDKKERLVATAAERVRALIETRIWDSSQSEMSLNRLVARFVDYRGATPDRSASGVPLATAGHIKDGQLHLEADPQFVSDDTYATWMRRGFPTVGDVLMTMEAPLGHVAQVDSLPIALAQRVVLMKPDERFVSGNFLALLLRSPSFQARLAGSATGSTALGIRSDRLKALRLPIVPRLDQERLVDEVRQAETALRRLADLLGRQSALLREHRQALMTAAVTGELAVPGGAA